MLQFLAWYDPSTWISSIGSEIMGAMEIGVRTLSFSLATIIYRLIIYLYDMFELLCRGRLLDNVLLKELSTRIGLILGIVMFLSVAFSMIKVLLEPDKINDKEMGVGAIIKKIILVIIMLGVSNFAFDALYNIQKIVVESHVISNLILPYKIEDDDLDSFGRILSEELMYAFYQVNDFNGMSLSTDSLTTVDSCRNEVNAFRNQIINSGKFELGYNCLNESVTYTESTGTSVGVHEKEIFVVNYNWILCIAAGAMAAYLMFMYCFKIGIRMIQLMFLEIISPVAIIGYLSPKKDNMFSKWSKIYISTYIDVFIRIIIINFVIFLIATVFSETGGDGHFKFWESIGGKPDDFASTSFITVVIVLALLTFAKKAPDLLKDLLGSNASKLGFGASMKDIVGLKNTFGIAAGVAGGAAVGLLAGRPLGAVGGMLKGGISGAKAKDLGSAFTGAWKNQSKANAEIAKVRANGGGWLGHQIAKAQQSIGMRTAYDEDLTTYNDNKAIADNYGNAKSEAEKEALKFASNYIHQNGYSLGELAQRKVNQNLTDDERFEAETQYNQLLDAATKFNIGIGRGVKHGKVEFDGNYNFKTIKDTSGSVLDLNTLDLKTVNDDNAAIIYNRDYVLNQSGVGVTGNAIDDAKHAKNASDASKAAMSKHSTSKTVSRHKANAGK